MNLTGCDSDEVSVSQDIFPVVPQNEFQSSGSALEPNNLQSVIQELEKKRQKLLNNIRSRGNGKLFNN